jgi:hypothetical protein
MNEIVQRFHVLGHRTGQGSLPFAKKNIARFTVYEAGEPYSSSYSGSSWS